MFLIQKNKDLLHEIGFKERYIIQLKLEFKNVLIEQHEEYLDFIKNGEETIIEKFLNKETKDIIHKRLLLLLLSLTDLDIL